MIFHVIYEFGHKFLSFCHKSCVWQHDRRTAFSWLDRVLYYMQSNGKNDKQWPKAYLLEAVEMLICWFSIQCKKYSHCMRTAIPFFTDGCRWRTGARWNHFCIRIYTDCWNRRRRSSWSWQRHFTGYQLTSLKRDGQFNYLLTYSIQHLVMKMVATTLSKQHVQHMSVNRCYKTCKKSFTCCIFSWLTISLCHNNNPYMFTFSLTIHVHIRPIWLMK